MVRAVLPHSAILPADLNASRYRCICSAIQQLQALACFTPTHKNNTQTLPTISRRSINFFS